MACLNCGHVAAQALAVRSTTFLVGERVIVLHAFIKKSQQTPDREIKLARKRLKEIKNG